jgi:hypothetical protein
MMRNAFTFVLPLLAAILAKAGHAEPVLDATKPISCNVQVSVHCDPDCEFSPLGPAAIGVDIKAGTMEYCYGEHCEQGTVKGATDNGYFDQKPYLRFSGTLKDSGQVHGVISPSSRSFYMKDSFGEVFGTCTND